MIIPVLRIRGEDGQMHDIPAISGPKGDPGYTPQRGVDYWTQEDIAQINAYIDQQLGVIENGAY